MYKILNKDAVVSLGTGTRLIFTELVLVQYKATNVGHEGTTEYITTVIVCETCQTIAPLIDALTINQADDTID